MLRKTSLLAASLALFVLAIQPRVASGGVPSDPPAPASVSTTGDLLTNGHMDEPTYYWRPTNHFVAGGWFEWWAGDNLPEFIDGGHPYHGACYPQPTVGNCATNENHSQGYIRYGGPWIAGIYQPVSVTPCTTYRFEIYNRNDEANYHPKIGIDPTGWQLPYENNNPPDNCPPTGSSPCPNPRLPSVSDFPSTMIWSPEFDHAAFTWAAQIITAEARANTITVWTVTAPDESGSVSRSTYWDYASLVQVAPASGALISGVFPPADGTISNLVTSTTAIRLNLSYQTSQAAVTQVLYHYVSDPAQPIASDVSQYEIKGAIDTAAAMAHAVTLGNLRPTSTYDYAILSRKVVGSSCQTSVVTGRMSTTDALVPEGPLPKQDSNTVAGPTVLPFGSEAYVIWQSAKSSYGQVLYHKVVTATLPPTMTHQVFLPLVASSGGSDSTYNYELRTAPVFTATTLHVVKLEGLQPATDYAAVGVMSWSDGSSDKTAATGRVTFHTLPTGTAMLGADSADVPEQLQLCLAQAKSLDVCARELAR